ncbi:histidinol-phosphate transaminase [Microbacterium album]|uniref:Aromatic amino acid aminotransferase n=1 Tax=Microbacterium album TaxID=2053191 RepID=A0A917IBA3_9MICO|nr:histidinol-phosphate transaminase [Microbacterium album]GGH33283.1 putative phenylalanine aminotransferase [Microbacterium album]
MSELRVRADLAEVPAYKQGRSADAGDDRVIYKISSNENPYAPLPSVVDAVADALAGINRYPESAASALTARLAGRFGVAGEHLVFGAGSVEIVSQLMRATAGPGDEVLFAWRSFEAYPMLARAAGAVPVQVPLTADHRHDLPAMLAAITDRTRLVIVCNPNNPTGTTIGDAELRAFIDAVPPHLPVLIDEAYLHFNQRADSPAGIEYFRAYPNVVVAHTFSKAYGLAGVRVGYAIAPTTLAAAMRKVSVPFGVTSLAQVSAIASLDAEPELQERVDALVAERERVVSALTAAGWQLPETQTNFLWFPLGEHTADAMGVFDAHGLVVRGFPGEGLRATIAETEANDRLIAAATELRERELG